MYICLKWAVNIFLTTPKAAFVSRLSLFQRQFLALEHTEVKMMNIFVLNFVLNRATQLFCLCEGNTQQTQKVELMLV